MVLTRSFQKPATSYATCFEPLLLPLLRIHPVDLTLLLQVVYTNAESPPALEGYDDAEQAMALGED
ncbi:hypothetical protein D9757_010800 [Collybiopsis confluens]|uniref:Uncharacterized protein n=1 Tax=Collybiopsis confluens TaxID=2823264 RepID=A0A8H5LVQ6_9AGAR|nr:hypothetical protein D9757_010800 [Collybiopsis confluens]